MPLRTLLVYEYDYSNHPLLRERRFLVLSSCASFIQFILFPQDG